MFDFVRAYESIKKRGITAGWVERDRWLVLGTLDRNVNYVYGQSYWSCFRSWWWDSASVSEFFSIKIWIGAKMERFTSFLRSRDRNEIMTRGLLFESLIFESYYLSLETNWSTSVFVNFSQSSSTQLIIFNSLRENDTYNNKFQSILLRIMFITIGYCLPSNDFR